MINYAGLKAWAATANLRKMGYIAVACVAIFFAGFFIGADRKEDSMLAGQTKGVIKQADKAARQVAKDSNEAIKATNRVDAKTDKLDQEIQGVNDAISKAPASADCTLSADELREFNEAIDAANAS